MERVTNGVVSAAAMIYCPAQNVDLMTNSSLLTSPDRIPELGGFICIEIRGTMSSVVHLSGKTGCRGDFIFHYSV